MPSADVTKVEARTMSKVVTPKSLQAETEGSQGEAEGENDDSNQMSVSTDLITFLLRWRLLPRGDKRRQRGVFFLFQSKSVRKRPASFQAVWMGKVMKE